MTPTVHEIRNEIRVATGRFEREVSASFTKEELQAICETLEVDINGPERPSTQRMRQQIRVHAGIAESLETAADSTFRKAELEAIHRNLGS